VGLPLRPPIEPMLAKSASDLPAGDGYAFEPKWDGFRAMVWRDGDTLEVVSRGGKPLARYLPELVEALAARIPERCVLDGEIVIVGPEGALDFDALQARIHPAASRVELLARETPTSYVAFDVLALGDRSLVAVPFAERRAELEAALDGVEPPVHLTPQTTDRAVARDWFERFEGAGLDGVMAKRLAGRYEPGKRTLVKVKHERTADCVVAGYRVHKDGSGPGALLLGLYDDHGVLHSVGVASSFSKARRVELVDELAPFVMDDIDGHPWAAWADQAGEGNGPQAGDGGQRLPGAPSRWSGGKDASFVPLRPDLVVEVAYDHMQGDRFRHVAHFRRWRPDRDPRSCTYDQMETVPPAELAEIFPARR
jgi:ATP-dependent DNA ligase